MTTLTLLTPTGGRPQAWALCERWLAAQDYPGPVRWLIVDDGPEAQPVTFARAGWQLEVLRPQPCWRPGQNTQARNLRLGLDQIGPDDPVLIIEDDDHYAPDWLAKASAALAAADLVGETCMRYYNVAHRQWLQHSNTGHASLCATGLRGTALKVLRQACQPTIRYADLVLWRTFRGAVNLIPGHSVTGMKGLPGRAGICQGHRQNFLRSRSDPQGEVLRSWLGNDAQAYLV